MGRLLQDIRYGIRILTKNPGFTFVAVLTLALGIGANTAIFSVVERVLLRPLPYRNSESLVQIWNTYYPTWPQLGLSPGDFQDWRSQATNFSDMATYVSVAVGFVLLIACANIVNLLLARNAARQKEIALRIALGASRPRLIGQLLTESILLSLLGGALGLFLASAGLEILDRFVPSDLAGVKETGLNGWVLGFTIAVCVLSGIVCGLVPALQTLKSDLHGVLKEGTRTSGAFGGQKVRSVLVVSQVVLAIIPLAGAGLLIRSFHRMLGVDPGFQPEHVLAMEIDQPLLSLDEFNKLSQEQQQEFGRKQSLAFQNTAERVKSLPGVKSVGGVDVLPLGSKLVQASRFVVEGQPISVAAARPVAETRTASLGYFSAMGIPLRRGRLFTEADWIQKNLVINESMARRFWPAEDSIGKRVNLCWLDPEPCWFSIIGVVGNVRQYGLDGPSTFDVYFTGGWTRYLVIRTASDPSALAQAAIEEVHKADPNLPVTHVMTLDNLLSDSFSLRRFSTVLLGVFAILALVLAAVGIYGVMSYVVSWRTREIGIRMALGAQRRDVLNLIVGRGARVAFAGIALGLAGALALTRLLASMLYGVGAGDPVTITCVALLLAGVALFACYIPARRAMRVDPMVALHYE